MEANDVGDVAVLARVWGEQWTTAGVSDRERILNEIVEHRLREQVLSRMLELVLAEPAEALPFAEIAQGLGQHLLNDELCWQIMQVSGCLETSYLTDFPADAWLEILQYVDAGDLQVLAQLPQFQAGVSAYFETAEGERKRMQGDINYELQRRRHVARELKGAREKAKAEHSAAIRAVEIARRQVRTELSSVLQPGWLGSTIARSAGSATMARLGMMIADVERSLDALDRDLVEPCVDLNDPKSIRQFSPNQETREALDLLASVGHPLPRKSVAAFTDALRACAVAASNVHQEQVAWDKWIRSINPENVPLVDPSEDRFNSPVAPNRTSPGSAV